VFDVTLASGTQITETLTISNTGTGPLGLQSAMW